MECLVNEPILNDLPYADSPIEKEADPESGRGCNPFSGVARAAWSRLGERHQNRWKAVNTRVWGVVGHLRGALWGTFVGRCGGGVVGGVAGSGAARPSPRRADAPACTLRELACGRHACRSGWWRCPSGLGCPVSRANPLRLRAYAWRMNGAGYADEGSPPR